MMWDALKMGDWCVCVFSLTRHRLTHCWRKPTANGVHKKYWLIHTHTRDSYQHPFQHLNHSKTPVHNAVKQMSEADSEPETKGEFKKERTVDKFMWQNCILHWKSYIYIYLFILNYLFLLKTQTHKQEWCPYTDRGVQLLCLISLGLRIKSFLSFDFSEIRADINTGLSKPLRQGN